MSGSSDKRSRGIRVLSLAFALLFILLAITAWIVYLGFHGTPTHWQQEQARLASLTEAQQQARSESFRNSVMTKWGDPGEKTPVTEADLFGHRQTIEMSFDDLNTWIKSEGVALLAEVGVEVPDSATNAMVDSPGDGLLRISFEVDYQGNPRIIALSFDVMISNDGTLTSTLKQATAGKLPLPVGTAINLVASQVDEGVLLDLMRGNPIPPIELPIDVSDTGRDARLVGLQVSEDALTITRETVRRQKK